MVKASSFGKNPSGIGCGLAAKNRSEKSSYRREYRTNMKCSHCGGSRHIKDGRFKLIGYLEWWDDLQRKKAATKAPINRAGGKALFTAVDSTGGRHTEGLEETAIVMVRFK